jgi:hypothetical protein
MSDKQPPKYPNRHDSGIPTNELVIPFPATTITTITTIQNRIWIERALKSWKQKQNQNSKKKKKEREIKGFKYTPLSRIYFSSKKDEPGSREKDPPFSQFNLNFFDVRRSATMINSCFFFFAQFCTQWLDQKKNRTQRLCVPLAYISNHHHITFSNKVDEGGNVRSALCPPRLVPPFLTRETWTRFSSLILLTSHWTCSSSLRLMDLLHTQQ